MKLYVFDFTPQAYKALKDFVGQKVHFVTSNLVFKGTLRLDKRKDSFYIKNKERLDIRLSDIIMIVDHDETKIITKL